MAQSYLASLQNALRAGNNSRLEREIKNQTTKARDRAEIVKDAMIIACQDGVADAVDYLLKLDYGASKFRTKEGASPLHLAVIAASDVLNEQQDAISPPASHDGMNGNAHKGLAINDRSAHPSERLRIVESLLDAGVDMKAINQDVKSALMYARHVDIVDLMLRKLPQVEIDELLKQQNLKGEDALLISIIDDRDCKITDCLIRYKANLRTRDNRHRTALMAAAWKNKLSIVDEILCIKGEVGVVDDDGRNIWHHVAQDNSPLWNHELVDKFLHNPAALAEIDTLDNRGRTCLHWIATLGNLSLAEKLFRPRCLFQANTITAAEAQHDKTALHFAAAYNRTEILKLLLKHGARADAVATDGWTALHMACGNGVDSLEIVKLLLADTQNRVKINARLVDGQTALHIAAAYGLVAVVEYLLKQGAEVDAQELGGFTAMHVACGSRAPWYKLPEVLEEERSAGGTAVISDPLQVVAALLANGAGLNSPSHSGKTPLHIAAESGDKQLVDYLLTREGIKWSTQDKSGTSPLLGASIAKSRLSKESIASMEGVNHVIKVLAPWATQQKKALTPSVKRVTESFRATIVRFDERERLYRVPVYDLLYKGHGEQGCISKEAVSTRCSPPPNPTGYAGPKGRADVNRRKKSINTAKGRAGERLRWIHLPANNTAWCRALLTKRFIEDGCSDIRGFKDMERALNDQHHGRTPHSHYIRPGAQSLTHLDPAEVRSFSPTSRSNSAEMDFHSQEHASRPKAVRTPSDKPPVTFGTGTDLERPSLPQLSHSAPIQGRFSQLREEPGPMSHNVKANLGNIFVSIPYLDFELSDSQLAMRKVVDNASSSTAAPMTALDCYPKDELLI